MSLDIALKVSSSERRIVILLMESVQIFSLRLCLRTRGELMLKLIFLLFSKIKGFLGGKFTSEYLSTYLRTKK